MGSRVNADSVSLYNPLNFNDWFFIGYNTDDRVYPGDWNMNSSCVVDMFKRAFVYYETFGGNYSFESIVDQFSNGGWFNGVATLTWVTILPPVLLSNPNIIKVHCGSLPNIQVNAFGFSRDNELTPDTFGSPGL